MECYEHAKVIVASTELTTILKEATEDTLDSKQTAGTFKPIEDVKEVPMDPSYPNSKVLRISTTLSSK